MTGCRVPPSGVGLHGWLSCSRLRVWGFMAGCRVPAFGCGASCLAVALPCFHACGASCLAVVLPCFQAGGEPPGLRPHIADGHPGRGTHPLLSAAALSLKWVPLRIFFNRLFLYLSII